jgi:hypothetical protein
LGCAASAGRLTTANEARTASATTTPRLTNARDAVPARPRCTRCRTPRLPLLWSARGVRPPCRPTVTAACTNSPRSRTAPLLNFAEHGGGNAPSQQRLAPNGATVTKCSSPCRVEAILGSRSVFSRCHAQPRCPRNPAPTRARSPAVGGPTDGSVQSNDEPGTAPTRSGTGSAARTSRTVTPRRDPGSVENQPQLPLFADTGRPVRRRIDGDWRIDEPTRRVGRRGLAAARAALARSAAPEAARATAA